jgi:SAM-dependent methyltransferase
MSYSPEAIRTLQQSLASYGKDVYAKKNLAYQHIEIDGQVIIEGEHQQRTEERKSWIRDAQPAGKTVLDLGCNLGVFAMEAARLGARHATGMDIQPNVISAANRIREFFGLANCSFQAVDLMKPEARAAVPDYDLVLAFAVYDHLVDRHKEVTPPEREQNYLDITEWMARIARRDLIVEFHNKQMPWAKFYEDLLVEHGFAILDRKTTRIERPVFFCRRGPLAHDEMEVAGQTYRRLRSWRKRERRLYEAERGGQRFLIKRYSESDLQFGRKPEHEFNILRAFADVPDIIQPVAFDARRLVLPFVEAQPVEVIDEQPLQAARLETPAQRYRVVEAMARVLTAYHERRANLFAQFAATIPDRYRDDVRTGKRLLVDLCRSNILVTPEGQIRFSDFEPSKPPLAERITREMQELCQTEPRPSWWSRR